MQSVFDIVLQQTRNLKKNVKKWVAFNYKVRAEKWLYSRSTVSMMIQWFVVNLCFKNHQIHVLENWIEMDRVSFSKRGDIIKFEIDDFVSLQHWCKRVEKKHIQQNNMSSICRHIPLTQDLVLKKEKEKTKPTKGCWYKSIQIPGGGWWVVNWWEGGWLVSGDTGGYSCGILISRTPSPLLQHLQSLQEMMMSNPQTCKKLQAEQFSDTSDLVSGTN